MAGKILDTRVALREMREREAAKQATDYPTDYGTVPLPELIISGSDPTATAKDLAALIAKRTDFLFNGHAPIHVAAEADCLPRALEVTTEMVRVLAHEICIPTKVRITKGKKGKFERIPAPLSKDIALLYLNGLEGSWGLKPFRGIVTAPILSDDGSVRSASGYDARSGLWCHNIPNITIPAKPTESAARNALTLLREFFRTFPFADAVRLNDRDLGVEIVDLAQPVGLDESSFLAALLTAVCRQSLELTPGFLCDAPNYSGAGTGKGLLVKATCVIASGVKPSAFTSGHDDEEFDKRLTAALTEAHPAVFLDNFNNKNLTSDILASALTESPAMVRPMGHTKTVPLHTRTFIGITGNSVQIAEDMARRLLNTHIDARMENPEQRPFSPGFLDHVFAERAKLLAAALTIWRWGRQTPLKPGKPLGSYEVWAQWCRDPLLALGMRDPVYRLTEIKAADPKRRALIAIFDQWWTSHGDIIIKAKDLADEVIKQIDDKATIRADGSLQYSRQWVASFLAAHDGTRVGGYVLSKMMLGPPSKEVAHYKLAQRREEKSNAHAK
jgi:putative DNA primase/helicase